MDKQAEYLKLLQERNRLKKLMATKSKEELEKEELEKGFSTHFRALAASNKLDKATSIQAHVSSSKVSHMNSNNVAVVHEQKRGWGKQHIVVDNEQNRWNKHETNANSDTTSTRDSEHKLSDDELQKQLIDNMEAIDEFRSSWSSPTFPLKETQDPIIAPDSDLDDLLMNKISSLDSRQKKRLAKLLQDESLLLSSIAAMPTRSPVDHSEYASDQVLASTKISSELSNQSAVVIKIRIYDSWAKTKFVSLQALRFRLMLPSGFIDLLSAFSVKVYSGLTALSSSADCVKQFSMLTSVGARLQSRQQLVSKVPSDWKAPLSVDKPLDISLEGTWPSSFLSAVDIHFLSVEDALNSVYLLIWSDSPTDDCAKMNTSSARNIDVYLGQQCAWSGELSAAGANVSEEYSGPDAEPTPSLAVRLFTKTSLIKRTLIKGVPVSPSSLPVNGSPAEKSGRKEDLPLPDWLHPTASSLSLGAKNATDVLLEGQLLPGHDTTSKPARPKSGRRSIAVAQAEDKTVTSAAPHQIDFSSPDRSVVSSGVARRRARRSETGVTASPSGTEDVDTMRSSSNVLRHTSASTASTNHSERQRDRQVRESQEAIQLAERSNRGRLSSSVALTYNSVLSDHPQRPEDAPVPLSAEAKRLSRNSRIAAVTDKLQSAIYGLSHIMSAMDGASVSANVSAELPDQNIPLISTEPSLTVLSLPRGSLLTLEILSTWGDVNYVGLNGIELYDSLGNLVPAALSGRQPAGASRHCVTSITQLNTPCESSAAGDPRKVENLMDGVNFTKNDLHMWLTPVALQSAPHDPLAVIRITLNEAASLSALRIFNFNKDRTHNQRGVRACRVLLDERLVYEGEICKATGQLLSTADESELILFTDDAAVLAALEQNMPKVTPDCEEDHDPLEESMVSVAGRPSTALEQPTNVAVTEGDKSLVERQWEAIASVDDLLTLATSMVHNNSPGEKSVGEVLSESNAYLEQLSRFVRLKDHLDPVTLAPTDAALDPKADHVQSRQRVTATCRRVRLDLHSTWGDPSYIGLCGVEVLLGSELSVADIQISGLDASPRDLSSVGCFDDPRQLKNVVSGVNDTARDEHMWLVPFTPKATHFLELDLKERREVAGLRVWNYNKSSEDVLRGAKEVSILLDGRRVCSCVLRMGPGCDGVAFGQTLLFNDLLGEPHCPPLIRQPFVPPVRQDYEVAFCPCGLLWRFTFFDNWNDGYYIGLDRMELFGSDGLLLDVDSLGAQVCAVPYSVHDLLPSVSVLERHEPRTPGCLFLPPQTRRGSQSDEHCWLSPLSRCMTPSERVACARRLASQQSEPFDNLSFPKNNTLFVSFQSPVTISLVKLYNYSKSTARGVREFSLELDGRLLYMGTLQPADREKTRAGASVGQALLLSDGASLVQQNRELVSYCGAVEQDVLCINERQVMVRSKNMYDQSAPNVALEGVEADLNKRPGTAFVTKAVRV